MEELEIDLLPDALEHEAEGFTDSRKRKYSSITALVFMEAIRETGKTEIE